MTAPLRGGGRARARCAGRCRGVLRKHTLYGIETIRSTESEWPTRATHTEQSTRDRGTGSWSSELKIPLVLGSPHPREQRRSATRASKRNGVARAPPVSRDALSLCRRHDQRFVLVLPSPFDAFRRLVSPSAEAPFPSSSSRSRSAASAFLSTAPRKGECCRQGVRCGPRGGVGGQSHAAYGKGFRALAAPPRPALATGRRPCTSSCSAPLSRPPRPPSPRQPSSAPGAPPPPGVGEVGAADCAAEEHGGRPLA